MKPTNPELKIALLADDFNPEWPSLPIVGFKYAVALARHADITVFTQVRNRENVEKLGKLSFPVHFVDTEYIASPMYKLATWVRGGNELGWTTQMAFNYIPYIEFERRCLKSIKASGIEFDVIHRITPMSPTLPSFAAGRTSAPFVLGPLNGNLPWPREFLAEERREREILNRFKRAYKMLPFARSTFNNAAAILAAFPHTVAAISAKNLARTFDVPEIGYDPSIFYSLPRKKKERLTFLYAGRLVPYKLPEFAIRAFAARPELQRHRLRIIGTGPDERNLQKLANDLNLTECVEFVGGRSQSEVADEMRAADVFFFPSIRELGAGVVIEALACGLPCLVADYGAPGAMIDESRGRKIAIADRETMIRAFADAALSLAAGPVSIPSMSKACAHYAQNHFTWDRKAATTVQIYEWVSGTRSEKPTFQY